MATHAARPGFGSLRAMRLFTLTAGPVLSLYLLRTYTGLDPVDTSAVEVVLFLAWSPLFFSIPALLCQEERDSALSELTGLRGSAWRAAVLVPFLVFSRKSDVRLETTISLVMWAVLGVSVWQSLVAWSDRLLPF